MTDAPCPRAALERALRRARLTRLAGRGEWQDWPAVLAALGPVLALGAPDPADPRLAEVCGLGQAHLRWTLSAQAEDGPLRWADGHLRLAEPRLGSVVVLAARLSRWESASDEVLTRAIDRLRPSVALAGLVPLLAGPPATFLAGLRALRGLLGARLDTEELYEGLQDVLLAVPAGQLEAAFGRDPESWGRALQAAASPMTWRDREEIVDLAVRRGLHPGVLDLHRPRRSA